MPTPMVGNLKLSKTGSDYLQDPTMYRSVVGALQYATITRPEISFLSTRPASSSLSN
jgi:hypothetical protein